MSRAQCILTTSHGRSSGLRGADWLDCTEEELAVSIEQRVGVMAGRAGVSGNARALQSEERPAATCAARSLGEKAREQVVVGGLFQSVVERRQRG